jgi:hypothetical protein
MKQQCIFEIGSEGGSLAIYRVNRRSETIYIYSHQEIDFSDEGMDISFKHEYSNFKEAFEKHIQLYPWWSLSILHIDEEYKLLVAEELVKKLNTLSDYEVGDFLCYYKMSFENLLGISIEQDKQNVFTNIYDLTIKPIDESVSYAPTLFKELNIVGNVEIQYNSLIIKDVNDKTAFILPSDKYMVELVPRYETRCVWKVSNGK